MPPSGKRAAAIKHYLPLPLSVNVELRWRLCVTVVKQWNVKQTSSCCETVYSIIKGPTLCRQFIIGGVGLKEWTVHTLMSGLLRLGCWWPHSGTYQIPGWEKNKRGGFSHCNSVLPEKGAGAGIVSSSTVHHFAGPLPKNQQLQLNICSPSEAQTISSLEYQTRGD